MTLSADTVKVQYDGDGSTTAFAITFVYWDDADIRAVLRVDATGVETVWVLNTDFTLSGGSGSTGTLTATTAPASGETLTIKSNRAYTQPTDLARGGPLPASALELAIDQVTRLVQQLNEAVARTISLAETTESASVSFPDLAANVERLLRINSAGTGLEAVALSSIDASAITTPVSLANGGTAADLSSPTGGEYVRINSGGTAFETRGFDEQSADLFTKGGDIASASPLVIDSDGNYFDVTGTTGFSAMTVAAGRLFILQFDNVLTMTDGASLDLAGTNITTAAGDRGVFYATAANTVQLIAWISEGGQPGNKIPSQAVQADIEAETNQDTYIPPDLLLYSPRVAKGAVEFNGAAADIDADATKYGNIGTLTDNGTGDYTIGFSPSFSGGTYAAVASAGDSGAAPAIIGADVAPAVSAWTAQVTNNAGSNVDAEFIGIAFFGDL